MKLLSEVFATMALPVLMLCDAMGITLWPNWAPAGWKHHGTLTLAASITILCLVLMIVFGLGIGSMLLGILF